LRSFFNHLSLQAERFMDRKVNQAENLLKKKAKKAKKWYSSFVGDEEGYINEFHIFLCAFAVGVVLGKGCA
jgi:FUN14 domain-containing protein 1